MTARATEGASVLADRYKTIACLGESETATTYWATRLADKRHVVVKIPSDALLAQPSFAYLLERAALDLVRVKHPHIVHVLDAGRSDGVPFVVTDHVEGENLAQVLAGRDRPQTPTQIYAWLLDVAEALDFIHAKKVVHGEVRPTQIFQAKSDHWLLGDFAFAAALAGLERDARAALAPKPRGYTAPELRVGGTPTPATDQYALAACVYHAVLGDPPPEDARAREAALRERLSPEATEDVLRGLAEDPDARFASCYEFARAFGLERKRIRRDGFSETPFATPAAPAPEPAAAPLPPLDPAGADDDVAEGARCWRIRMGVGDRYARLGREGGFVAAGWDELGALEDLSETDEAVALPELIERYEHAYGSSGAAARVGAGQVWRFLREMRPGDVVVLPDLGEGVLHVGRVEGEARWLKTPTDGCRLPRRRAVRWLRDLPLGQVPNVLARAVDGTEPLANLDGHGPLVRDVARGRDVGPPGPGGEAALLERAVDSLYALPLEAFPRFLRACFAALGYDAEVLPGRAEETWEALGRVSAQGLAEVVLRVLAYRSRRELDVDVVFAARGALATDEQGAILTLGDFTARARAEASARGKKPVRLIDGPTLAALALEHWGDLPPAAREALGLVRVERATVSYHFEPMSR